MVEKDKPKNLMIIGYTMGIVVFLVAVVIFVDQYFKHTIRAEIGRKVDEAPATELRSLHAVEDSRLGRYSWVDQKAGIVRLPLDKAVELTLRDWDKRPSGVVLPPADPAAPAPGTPDPAAPAPGTPAAPAPGTPAAPAPGTPAAPVAPAPAAPAPAPGAQP